MSKDVFDNLLDDWYEARKKYDEAAERNPLAVGVTSKKVDEARAELEAYLEEVSHGWE